MRAFAYRRYALEYVTDEEIRALGLFGRRPSECVDSLVMPASEPTQQQTFVALRRLRSSSVSPAKLLSLLQSRLTHAGDELSHRAGRERDVLLKPGERDLWLQLLETVERRVRLI